MKEYKLKINGTDYNVAIDGIDGIDGGVAQVSVNGTKYTVEVEHDTAPKAVKPVIPPPAPRQTPPPPQAAPRKVETAADPADGSSLRSPLPGIILEVMVREGDAVKEGQTVMILEAMKMENSIDVLRSGNVKKIEKRQGDSVLEGEILLTVE
jgi:biotin carboxyl carrier protein